MATIREALMLALDHQENGRPAEAEILYRRIVDADPVLADAWHLLGVLHAQTARTAEAGLFFHRAIALDPTRADYAANCGKLLYAAGRGDEAIRPCLMAVTLRPQGAEPWLLESLQQAGQRRLENGDAAGARRLLSAVVAANPAVAFPHAQLGLACQRLGLAAESERSYRTALELGFDGPELRDNLAGLLTDGGLARQRTGHHEQAIERFEAARRLFPDRTGRWLDLCLFTGVSRHALGEFDKAAQAFATAVALDPANPAGLASLGRAQLDAGQADRGVAASTWRWALAPTTSISALRWPVRRSGRAGRPKRRRGMAGHRR